MDLLSPGFVKWFLSLSRADREVLTAFLAGLHGAPEWPQRGASVRPRVKSGYSPSGDGPSLPMPPRGA